MVSYIRVHSTPEKYRGKQTDQSQDPLMADHPSNAPQLKVRPKRDDKGKNVVIYYIFICFPPRRTEKCK